MHIVSWNVNGLRAVAKKGFSDFLLNTNPDVLCIQETKAQPENLTQDHTAIGEYEAYFHSAKKKGYSGVATYSKVKPVAIIEGMGVEKFDDEGRVLTLEFEDMIVINTYVPNSQHGLVRFDYRAEFNDELTAFAQKLAQKKPVVICGDLNVAHNEIDIKNPKANEMNPGFYIGERNKFDELLNSGFIDTFRTLHPDTVKYSWWSYRFNARNRNIGWRIDYVLVSKELQSRIKSAKILTEIMGSDHCPVEVMLK